MPKQDKITNENNLDIHFNNLLRHQNSRGCYRMRLYDFEDWVTESNDAIYKIWCSNLIY